MNLRIATILILVNAPAIVYAMDLEGWGETKKQAALAINSGNCATAWSLVWPWARSGNIEARSILATSMITAGLMPPGSAKDSISRLRHSVIFAVHGSLNKDSAVTELLRALLRTQIVLDSGGKKFMRCLDSAENPPPVCVKNAVTAGFIPDFTDYARELDAIASSFGPPLASCDIPTREFSLPVPNK